MQPNNENINFRSRSTDVELLKKGMAQLPRALGEMGFDRMREGQDRGIISILGGQDTICVFPTAMGKCLGRDTPVLRYGGQVAMVQDLLPGDLLLGPDGLPRRIVSVCSGVEQLFRVVPKKGGEPYVVNRSHILSFQLNPGGLKGDRIRVNGVMRAGGDVVNLTVDEYLSSSSTVKHRLKGWRSAAIEFGVEDTTVEDMPPYLLGLWLGDGSLHSTGISKPDPEVEAYLRENAEKLGAKFSDGSGAGSSCPTWRTTFPDAHSGCRGGSNPMLNALRTVGVLHDKHIPDSYATAPLSKRLELLAGLTDSDGDLCVGGRGYAITSKYKRLADGIAFVARSCGFHASVAEKKVRLEGWTEPRTYWRVYYSGDVGRVPCKIARKIALSGPSTTCVTRFALTVEPMGEGEYFGFELEGPDRLFLLGDFTVTHNTAVFIVPTLCHDWRLLVFSPLKALMRDQVQALQNKGICALQLSSDQKEVENSRAIGDWVRGECKILYVAPERLNNEAFMRAMRQVPPDAVATDECFPGRFVIPCEGGDRTLEQLADDQDAGFPLPKAQTTDDQGLLCYRQIKQVFRREPRRHTIQVAMQPDGFVECTPDHRWFTARGEVEARLLLPGDQVVSTCWSTPGIKHGWHTVQRTSCIESFGSAIPELFDLEIEEFHRFFVKPESAYDGRAPELEEQFGVLVHNCHVLSAWSDNFRHSYCKIGDFVEQFNPRVVMAFTATMPKEVEGDVRRVLRMPDAVKIFHFPKRENLKLSSSDLDLYNDLNERVREIKGSTLVYCGSRELTVQTAQSLGRYLGEEVGFYHSEVKESVKKMYQDAFMDGSIRVMCATNAFGMGVDKADIRGVIHLRHPGDPESLAQECVHPDSWISTANGRMRARDVKVGERMPYYLHESIEVKEAVVVEVFQNHARGLKEIRTEHGLTMRVTADHPVYIYVEHPWGSTLAECAAGNLRKGDTICTFRDPETYGAPGVFTRFDTPGLLDEVEEVLDLEYDGPVLNWRVEPGNQLVVDGILTHNCGRAGRDGKDSVCHTYASKGALRMQEGFIDCGHPPKEFYERTFRFLSKNADAAGNYHLSYQEIEEGSRVGIRYLTAIFETFHGMQVIESLKDEPRVSKIRLLKSSELGRFIQLEHELDQLAARDGEWLLFDMDSLAAGMKVGAPTVVKYLNTWRAEGLLEYEPPPRGTAKKIIGDLRLIDFDRLADKRQRAYKKLEYVKGYFDIPDEEKHDYLQEYFIKL